MATFATKTHQELRSLGDGFPLRFIELSPRMMDDFLWCLVDNLLLLNKKGLAPKVLHSHSIYISFNKGFISAADMQLVKEESVLAVYTELFRYFILPREAVLRSPELTNGVKRLGYIDPYEFLCIFSNTMKVLPTKLRRRIAASRIGYPICLKSLNEIFVVGIEILKRQNFGNEQYVRFLRRYLCRLNGNKTMPVVREKWTNYYSGMEVTNIINREDWQKLDFIDERHKKVFELLSELPQGQVLDIASNTGLFSFIAQRAGHNVIAVDNDHGAIDKLYLYVKEMDLNVVPCVLSFQDLQGPTGTRFRSDYCLALGLTHHLFLVEGMSWLQIVSTLEQVSGKVLITDFKPITAARSDRIQGFSSIADLYNLDQFLATLRTVFGKVEVFNPMKGNHRALVRCER